MRTLLHRLSAFLLALTMVVGMLASSAFGEPVPEGTPGQDTQQTEPAEQTALPIEGETEEQSGQKESAAPAEQGGDAAQQPEQDGNATAQPDPNDPGATQGELPAEQGEQPDPEQTQPEKQEQDEQDEQASGKPQEEESAPSGDASDENRTEEDPSPQEEPGEPEKPEDAGDADNTEDASEEPADAEEETDRSEVAPVSSTATIAASVDISTWSGTLTYHEKSAPLVPAGKTHVLKLTVTGGRFPQDKIDSFTFTLKKDSAEGKQLSNPAFDGGGRIYWELGEAAITGAGSYTVEVTASGSDYTGTFSTEACQIVKVTFDAGEGEFVNGQKTYDGYSMNKKTGLHYFIVPNIEKTPDNKDFIGWSKDNNANSYEQCVNETDGTDNQQLYAAYGEERVYKLEYVDEQGTNTISELDLGSANYSHEGYESQAKEVKLKNAGNVALTNVRVMNTLNYFTVSPNSLGEETNLQKEGLSSPITITPKSNLGVGVYEETLYFWSKEAPGVPLTVKFTVTRPTVTVHITQDLTKTYGETKSSADVVCTTEPGADDLDGWTPTFLSDGFAADAAAGDHEIKLDTSKKLENYDVKLENENYKVKVNKATPNPVNVTATSVLEGKNLSDSKLSGTFENPNDSTMKVNGKLEWDSDQGTEQTTNLQEGTHQFQWKFTPSSGTDAQNYEGTSGSVAVHVTAKNPTDISLTTGTKFTYNGEPRGLTFTTDRPSNERGEIQVEYKLKDSGSFSSTVPKDAGTYEVKASIEASATYAACEETFTMTIEKRQLTVVVTGGDKVYDGTTNVDKSKLKFSYHNLVGNDSVEVKDTDYTATFRSPDVGNGQTLLVTVTSLSGPAAGNYALPRQTVHAVANITPATITKVEPKSAITKSYGATRALTMEDFTFTGLVNNEQPSVLNAEFLCAGQDAWTGAGDHDITVNLHGGNYVLANANAGKMTVTKAVPELLADSLHVSKGVAGQPLRIVSISASFVNPNNRTVSVPGKVAWADENEIMSDTADGTFEADWTFTPSDTANYDTPDNLEKAKITLADVTPVPFTVAEKEYTYNANPQGPTVADVTIQELEGDVLGEVEIKIEYRKYVELAKVDAISEPGTDWSDVMPTNAGKYQAKVIVTPADDTVYYTENENIISFSIEKADPDVSGVQTELQIQQGQTLHEADVTWNQPKGVDGKDLPGAFAWQNGDTPVTDDGEVYQWQFTPEDTDNYNTAAGSVTVNLAPDERKISAVVYNLPSAHGYTDYAVFNVSASALVPGDKVVFFQDADGTQAIGEAVTIAEGDTEIVVEFDDDALETTKGSIYARITSSKKHTPTAIAYDNEIDLELPETLTVYTGGTKELIAKAIGENFQKASFMVEEDHSVDLIGITEEKRTEDILTLKVSGKSVGAAEVMVEMTFPHPDTTRHGGETIVLRKMTIVTVLEGCDLTINGKTDASVPDPAAHEVQYTLTLFESGTQVPARVDGTFTATKFTPKTNAIRSGLLPIAQEPSGTTTEEITLTFTNGTTTFTCKANESITIHGLPTKTRFQVRVEPLDGEVVSTDQDSVLDGELTTEGGSVTSTLKEVQVESINVIPAELELSIQEIYTLEAQITPDNVAEANSALTWITSDASIVAVSEGSGLTNQIKAVGEGTATVTATTKNGLSDTCLVTVKANAHPTIENLQVTPHEITLVVGEQSRLKTILTPAVDVAISWESDNHQVATVDQNGNVTAVAAGTATVTAWTVNNKYDSCLVHVVTATVPTTTPTPGSNAETPGSGAGTNGSATGTAPATGDTTPLAATGLTTALSALGLVALILYLHRRHRED